MSSNIIGLMWNKNEGDILPFVIEAALKHVDSLYIADDGSSDNSWSIIQRYSKQLGHFQRNPTPTDPGQRQALLNVVKKRYKPEDTWVQIIESDIMILDTNIREAIKKFAVLDMAVTWQLLNAVRPVGTWKEVDTYPNWSENISKIMPLAHRIEGMLYTFRPLPMINYDASSWKPWPKGFSNYTNKQIKDTIKLIDSPLLAHYGYRGPTHFMKKFKNIRHAKWDTSSVERVEQTVPFFNGLYSSQSHEMSRNGWKKSRSGRQWQRLAEAFNAR